jgi:hypothetical protein
MASEMHCPLCGFLVKQRKDPKRSGWGPSVHIEMLNHINVYHQREIKERLERDAKKEEAALRRLS